MNSLEEVLLRDIEEKKAIYTEKLAKLQQIQADVPILKEQGDRLRDQIQMKKYELAARNKELRVVQDRLQSEKNKGPAPPKESTQQAVEREVLQNILKTLNPQNAPEALPPIDTVDCTALPKSKAKIHSVRLKLVRPEPNSTHVQIDQMSFKICSETTFDDLKEYALNFWEAANLENVAIYRTNLNKIDDCLRLVELFCLEHIEFPEFYVAEAKTDADNGELQDTKKEIDQLFARFHGLKQYLPPIQANPEEVDAERLENKNTSVWTFCFLMLVLAFTLVLILSQKSIQSEFWIQEGIGQYLSTPTNSGRSFEDIKTFDNFNEYVSDVVGSTFFTDDASSLCEKLTFVGPLRIRQVRTQEVDCEKSGGLVEDSVKCYASKYSDETKYTKDIGDNPWQKYLSTSETGITTKTYGEFGSYDGSGYLQDYAPCSMVANDFKANYTGMADGWFDGSVRAIFLTSTMYSPDYDMWVHMDLIVEVSVNALVYPTQLKMTPLKPNLMLRYPSVILFSVLRVLAVSYFFFLSIAIVKEVKDGHRNYQYCYSFLGIMDVLLVCSSILSLVLNTLIAVDEEELYNRDEFRDLKPEIRLSLYSQLATGVSLMVVLIRIILFLSLHNKIYIVICTIEHAGKNMLAYVLILCAVLSGFALIAQSIWGTYIHMYRNFVVSFLSLLLITNGHGQFTEQLEADLSWGIGFFVVYFFSVVFFLLMAFMGIYMDAFKSVKLVRGYDEVQKLSWNKFKQWVVPRWIKNLIKKHKWYLERRLHAEAEEDDSFN